MFEVMQISEATAARRRAFFHAVDVTDGITPKTALTGTGRISKNGAATAASTGNIVEIDSTNMPGRYYIEFTTTEIDTLGQVIFRYKNVACAEVIVQCTIVNYDPYAAGPTVQAIVDGILNEALAGHATAGTVGKAISDILGIVGTSGVAIANGAISSTKFVANAIGSGIIASAALNEIADALLKRDWTVVAGEASRSVLNALRAVRNKVTIVGSTATITKEDDVTTAYTAAIVGTPAVTSYDPN